MNKRPSPDSVEIRKLSSLSAEFEALCNSSCIEGYRFLTRLKEQWATYENRFDEPGECLLGAWSDFRMIGVGGLNIDPYIADENAVGRLQHVYVTTDCWQMGVGRLLISRLMQEAEPHFRMITLRVADDAGALFYECIGFKRVHDEHMSHAFQLPQIEEQEELKLGDH